jgi:hypothetical protein
LQIELNNRFLAIDLLIDLPVGHLVVTRDTFDLHWWKSNCDKLSAFACVLRAVLTN